MGDPVQAVALADLAVPIEGHRQVELSGGEEAPDRRVVLFLVDGIERDAVVLADDVGDHRERLHARTAPGRPEVQDHDLLALELGQLELTAVQERGLERGGPLAGVRGSTGGEPAAGGGDRHRNQDSPEESRPAPTPPGENPGNRPPLAVVSEAPSAVGGSGHWESPSHDPHLKLSDSRTGPAVPAAETAFWGRFTV